MDNGWFVQKALVITGNDNVEEDAMADYQASQLESPTRKSLPVMAAHAVFVGQCRLGDDHGRAHRIAQPNQPIGQRCDPVKLLNLRFQVA